MTPPLLSCVVLSTPLTDPLCTPTPQITHTDPLHPTQTLLDDPDLPGYQPALPRDITLEQLARDTEESFKRRRR